MSRDFDAGPRVRANNFFDIGVVGRRTGIAMKANIKKDADGLDNIDDFWDDSDDNGATDNNKNGTQDYAQEAFSGEDYQDEEEEERHPLPPTRRSDPRLYLQQEAPEELLLTPTSRRSRGSSKGTLTGDSSMYGSHLYTGAEESPSIDKVRKRLVFTKDFSDDEAEQTPAPRTQSNKPSSGSPALDKILNDSQQRKANMSKNVARDSSSAPKDKAPAKAPAAKVAPTKAPPAKAKQTTAQPSTVAASTKRSAHFPKAFDLGGDFNGEDDFALPVHNNTNLNLSDPDDDQRPPLAAAVKSKAGRTQPELKLKSNVAPARLMLSDDDLIHEEPETRPEDDDRLMFSDEDGPSRFDDDRSEDEEEALQDNRRKMDDIARKKRTASTVEPVSVSKGRKQALGATRTVAKQKNIPKKADFSKTAQQKQRRHEDEDDDVEESSSEDHREVPSMQPSGAKERPFGGSSKSNSRRKVDNGLESKLKIREDKTTTHEIPIVPEEKPEEGSGVRRSTRTKVAPLEFWKNEKLVFEKAVDEGVAGPVIKAVLRAQTEEGDPALRRKMPTKAGKKRKYTPRSETSAPPTRRQRTDRGEEEQEGTQEPHPDDFVDDSMDEEQVELATKGVREEFKQSAEILVYGSDEVVSRVVAESQSSIQFRNVQSGEYQFHRGLEDADTVVSGTMKIKPDGRKPVNSGSNTSMVFYVIKGLVQVKVHETQFVLSTGGRFLVPRGNTYSIVNLSTKESTLFFVQTKPPRPETTDTGTASFSAAATSNTTAGSSSNQAKNTAGDQSGPDNSDSDSSPSTAAGKKINSAALSSSKSPSPPPATTSLSNNNNNNKNRRRSPSVRQSLSKTSAAAFVGSPSPPPSSLSMTTTEAISKSNGVNRQPSVRPSVFR